MKIKKSLLLILVGVLLCFVVTGCATKPDEKGYKDITDLYTVTKNENNTHSYSFADLNGNILFEKDFTKHYDPAIEDSILAFYDYKRYCLTSKKHYDTIPPPDTIIFRFKYSLTPKGKAVTDTLLLTKRKSK